jgi:hypothetical protein
MLFFLICRIDAAGQNLDIADDQNNSVGHLEFTHPLITESISPDTKIRLTFFNNKLVQNAVSQIFDFEVEYSPVENFSIHLDLPYTFLHPEVSSMVTNLDETELTLKFSDLAFADRKVLLGYGISFGLPTGNQLKGIGSSHIWDICPFISAGKKWQKWEWTTYFMFTIPSNQYLNENLQSILEFRMTAIYHFNNRWGGLMEAGNEQPLSHFSSKENNNDLTEGIIYRPDPEKPWIISVGVRHPLFRNDEIKFQGVASLFYHFKDQ